MRFLFLLFIIVPIIEITVLLKVGELIGGWYTVGLVLLSAFIGVNMLRYQGLSTLARAQQRMAMGEMPGQEMIEGIVLAVGGALLVTPGFVTDVIGFSCLIPFTRQGFVRLLMSRFTMVTMQQNQNPFGASPFDAPGASPFDQAGQPPFHDDKPAGGGDVIDGEYKRKD
ncbi:FxsA family protein [Marinobacterium jannaschii]|uniref:FxsA family protein n=1 Tax=Marinobacterium jannaschii TaxID=64970 RepID=UPI00048231C8|nr:FxsA family protein [Marinobacterium jannaschii]